MAASAAAMDSGCDPSGNGKKKTSTDLPWYLRSFFDLLHGGSAMSTTKICELYQLNGRHLLPFDGAYFRSMLAVAAAERTHDALGEKAKNLVRCTSHLGSVVNDITQVSCGGTVFLKSRQPPMVSVLYNYRTLHRSRFGTRIAGPPLKKPGLEYLVYPPGLKECLMFPTCRWIPNFTGQRGQW